MKIPCRIQVKSTRNIQVPDFLKPSDPSAEEEWEDLLWDAGLSPEDKAPSDQWQDHGGGMEGGTSFTSLGIFSREWDGSLRITYKDSEITGLEGCLTTFCLSPTGMLIMLRQGAVKTCMVFEKGHRHLCDYGAEGGIPSVFLHTHDLDARVNEAGGGDLCFLHRGNGRYPYRAKRTSHPRFPETVKKRRKKRKENPFAVQGDFFH